MGREHYSDLVTCWRLFREARPYWSHLAAIFLLDMLWVPQALLAPLPLTLAVDSAIGGKPLPGFLAALMPELESRLDTVLALAVALSLALALAGQLRDLATSLLRTHVGERLTLHFRARLFLHAQHLSLAYHDARGSFDATHRIWGDAPCIQWITIYGVIPIVTATCTLTGMLYVTALLDWQLALIALATSPVIFLLSRIHCRCVRYRWDAVRERDGAAMTLIQEVLSALRVVKAFGREGYETARFTQRTREVIHANVRVVAINGGFDLLRALMMATGGAAVLALGVLHVRAGVLTVGEFLLVIGYAWQILGPVHTISNGLSSMQVALSSARRALALSAQPPDVPERPTARPITRATGAVTFRHVSFAYEAGRWALRSVSFHVKPGTRIGIMGQTGAGKTTLVSLLTRFYDPSEGAILLDGTDLRDYRLADLRDQFAIVLQELVLFSASIAENIAYGRPGAGRDEIVAAAEAARVHDFVTSLPAGYETQVGERGLSLSGGERQRITLARAFLKDAPILILDEPTSSVDYRTEGAIVEVLGRLMAGRTTFIIAHRPSTLVHCDVHLVLESGRFHDVEVEGGLTPARDPAVRCWEP